MILNFDYLRLVLAIIVMLTHYDIYHSRIINGSTAVLFFFVISGYLIFKSLQRSENLSVYLEKRIRRIYPPIIIVVLSALIYGIITEKSPAYILTIPNILFFQEWSPAGNNIFSNGVFWTLVVEMQFYLILPLIYHMIRKVNIGDILLIIGLFLLTAIVRILRWDDNSIGNIIRQSIIVYSGFFLAGIFLALHEQKIMASRKIWMPILLSSCWIFYRNYFHPNLFYQTLFPFSIAALTYFLARSLVIFGKNSFFGDISYGIYLYHFLVMQWCVENGITNVWVWVGISIVSAFISWHLIEKKILKKDQSKNSA